LARALARLEYHAQGRLAVVGLPLARERDADLIETDDLLDLLRSVRTVEVVLFLREQKDGTVKLSARSKTDFDVNRLARRFGGGGHAKASGATLAALTAAALEELASASAR
jgi:phosphoesterase RecJ-like protein